MKKKNISLFPSPISTFFLTFFAFTKTFPVTLIYDLTVNVYSIQKNFSTYYTLYDVQSPLRGKIRSVQLVSLIRSSLWKKHGNLTANERFLKDLKYLENVGVKVAKPTQKFVKVGLGAMVGDNLGLHQLSELNSVFSSGNICRGENYYFYSKSEQLPLFSINKLYLVCGLSNIFVLIQTIFILTGHGDPPYIGGRPFAQIIGCECIFIHHPSTI